MNAIQAYSVEKNYKENTGFDKGPSSFPVTPLKKATLVNYDEKTLIDDYAYLASVPTSVFKDNNQFYSHPLIFYQDEYKYENDKKRTLNARQGIDYFIEDYLSYSEGQLDQMTTVNVPKSKVSQWSAKEYVTIDSNSPYKIAKNVALNDWSYSDEAVVSVIDDQFEKINKKESGILNGRISINKETLQEHFEVEQTNSLNPVSNFFTVPDGYMYVYARCWYPSVTLKVTLPLPGFEMTRHIAIPSGDKDLQLYCNENGEWMQVLALDAWNQGSGMDKEKEGTYVYNTGKWRATVTDIPTKKFIEITERHGSWKEIRKNLRQVTYEVDIYMYPGKKIPLLDDLPFDCRNLRINLDTKGADADLGFSLIGPSGEEIKASEDGVIKVERLGGLLEDESYDIAIYSMSDKQGSFDYEISYSYETNQTSYKADCLTNAAEGAILASTLNAPLLYTSKNKLSDETKDVLYKLGVKKIHLLNIGNHVSSDVKNDLEEIAELESVYQNHKSIYDAIRERTECNDVIFSTLDSWKPWYVYERTAADDIKLLNSLFIGPAALCAAHHGSPLLITENHPELSSATVWHNEFWKKASINPIPNSPTTAEMYLTGKRVYDFLKEYGFDEQGEESMITVAGQFNIGASWDRVFFGPANYGRFFGSPVDSAYWISRNIFYPALIFTNPGMSPEGVQMWNGSVSHRRAILPWGGSGLLGGLKIDRPSEQEEMTFPVASSFLHYEHRFNERASKYWGFKYQCADGLVPGETNTMNPIDQGVSAYIDEEGSIFPDMSISDVLPAYVKKGGYSNALSTNFDKVMENVNNGVLLWNHYAHGYHKNGGETQYFDSKHDPNPWRMYEFYLGSTEEPDTLTIEIHGIIPGLLGNPNSNGFIRTALDWAPAKKPILDKISAILSYTPVLRKILPEGLLDTQDYYDGMINTLLLSKLGAISKNGTQIDDALENIHSTGYITNACLMATKYIHLMLIRHGSSFQIMDPWPTSWYGSVWAQSVPRDIILGNTVGEAFNKGISHVGILYLTDPPQWWWDNSECVCYYGDPDLRMFVPNTEYSSENYWTEEEVKYIMYDSELNINGHMPFGATSYPNELEPGFKISMIYLIIAIIFLIIIAIIAIVIKSKKSR